MNKHVLVIEHDPLVRNSIASLLEQRSFTCDQAATLDDAVTLLAEHHYNVLMLDLMMPDENGFAALAHIRQNYPEQSHHTIVMTGADRKFIEKMPAEGWCAVLVKPVVASELYRVVDLCLGGTHEEVAYHTHTN